MLGRIPILVAVAFVSLAFVYFTFSTDTPSSAPPDEPLALTAPLSPSKHQIPSTPQKIYPKSKCDLYSSCSITIYGYEDSQLYSPAILAEQKIYFGEGSTIRAEAAQIYANSILLGREFYNQKSDNINGLYSYLDITSYSPHYKLDSQPIGYMLSIDPPTADDYDVTVTSQGKQLVTQTKINNLYLEAGSQITLQGGKKYFINSLHSKHQSKIIIENKNQSTPTHIYLFTNTPELPIIESEAQNPVIVFYLGNQPMIIDKAETAIVAPFAEVRVGSKNSQPGSLLGSIQAQAVSISQNSTIQHKAWNLIEVLNLKYSDDIGPIETYEIPTVGIGINDAEAFKKLRDFVQSGYGYGAESVGQYHQALAILKATPVESSAEAIHYYNQLSDSAGDQDMRWNIIQTLAAIEDSSAIDFLRDVTLSPPTKDNPSVDYLESDTTIRLRAVSGLSRIAQQDSNAEIALLHIIENSSGAVQKAAIHGYKSSSHDNSNKIEYLHSILPKNLHYLL